MLKGWFHEIKKPDHLIRLFILTGSPRRIIVRTFAQLYIYNKIKGLRKVASGPKHKINYSGAYLIMISTLFGQVIYFRFAHDINKK